MYISSAKLLIPSSLVAIKEHKGDTFYSGDKDELCKRITLPCDRFISLSLLGFLPLICYEALLTGTVGEWVAVDTITISIWTLKAYPESYHDIR